jgi:hypothetical protein
VLEAFPAWGIGNEAPVIVNRDVVGFCRCVARRDDGRFDLASVNQGRSANKGRLGEGAVDGRRLGLGPV